MNNVKVKISNLMELDGSKPRPGEQAYNVVTKGDKVVGFIVRWQTRQWNQDGRFVTDSYEAVLGEQPHPVEGGTEFDLADFDSASAAWSAACKFIRGQLSG